ncbi:MAG: hypothetical protein IIV07_05200 [Treponema sp.]|nr:hypothetical protein [Treponema sp.]
MKRFSCVKKIISVIFLVACVFCFSSCDVTKYFDDIDSEWKNYNAYNKPMDYLTFYSDDTFYFDLKGSAGCYKKGTYIGDTKSENATIQITVKFQKTSADEAAELKAKFEEAGATIELK